MLTFDTFHLFHQRFQFLECFCSTSGTKCESSLLLLLLLTPHLLADDFPASVCVSMDVCARACHSGCVFSVGCCM